MRSLAVTILALGLRLVRAVIGSLSFFARFTGVVCCGLRSVYCEAHCFFEHLFRCLRTLFGFLYLFVCGAVLVAMG